MPPKSAFPPHHPHPGLTLPHLAPTAAQTALADFLARTHNQPSLHPDALLSTSGIAFAAHSGPQGGLALHHLQRIAAGLRGENLVVETEGELAAQFGGESAGLAGEDKKGEGAPGELPEGDDAKVDALIDHRGASGKRKRNGDDVAAWAASTALADPDQDIDMADAVGPPDSEWQDPDTYALTQQPMSGEVGARAPAHVVQQNGAPPTVGPEGATGAGGKTEAEKAARRAAKKERAKAERRGKAMGAGQG